MADNSFSSTVASLFKGMDSFITKVLDMVPDFVNKFTSKDKEPSEGEKKAAKEMEDILTDAVNPSEE